MSKAFYHAAERFCIVEVGSSLIICLYLPALIDDTSRDIILGTLTEVQAIASNFPTHSIICGGDFNVNMLSHCRENEMIIDFMNIFGLKLCTSVISSNNNIINHTYRQETLGHFSLIDFLMISTDLVAGLCDYDIIDNALNISDHNPVRIAISSTQLKVLMTKNVSVSNDKVSSSRIPVTYKCYRWDHACLSRYYQRTYVLLNPVYDSLMSVYSRLMGIKSRCCYNNSYLSEGLDMEGCYKESVKLIEYIYSTVIASLDEAAQKTVPKINNNFFKFWWDQEMDALKEESIKSHKSWIDHGRPRHGLLFDRKVKAKILYRKAIKQRQKRVQTEVSGSLADALCYKDSSTFWKMWKNKFNNKMTQATQIDGINDDMQIADNFAELFGKSCKDNISFTDKTRNMLVDRLKDYSGDNFDHDSITVELVTSIIDKLKFGKAAGIDSMSCEHIRYAHPVVTCILAKLFNLMSAFNYVPDEFGKGVIIPIPKGQDKHAHSKSDNYRGITISPVISKIYELCISKSLHSYLKTSGRQMGFKKGVGCSSAIFAVRKTIDFFTSNSSTVNICTVDLSKAFDRISHDLLMIKLMDRHVPRCFIDLLRCWYDKMICTVKWGSAYSKFFSLSAGVRQGGILSPALFAVYVDVVLDKLEKSKLGCFVQNCCSNSYMYADDLILLSISIKDLQLMIGLCELEFKAISMEINVKKTECLRIGRRHAVAVKEMCVLDQRIAWKQELKYLGLVIVSANSFKANLQSVKQKFFRAVNSIFGKVGMHTSAELLCALINAQCVPILFYASEVLSWKAKDVRSMTFAYNQAFFKIFRTFDPKVVRECQFYMRILPFDLLLDLRRLNFLDNVDNVCFNRNNDVDLAVIMQKYGMTRMIIGSNNWKHLMWAFFSSQIDTYA